MIKKAKNKYYFIFLHFLKQVLKLRDKWNLQRYK